jgi:hypothetical protein
VELFNFPLSRLSDSPDMTPWEVIQLALAHKTPPRNMQWLADQLSMSIQAVSNWKGRGVPARHYREIASALGITVDQLEGLERLPWESTEESAGLSPEVAELAAALDNLPRKQRDWVLMTLREAVKLARETVTESSVNQNGSPREEVTRSASSKRRKAA